MKPKTTTVTEEVRRKRACGKLHAKTRTQAKDRAQAEACGKTRAQAKPCAQARACTQIRARALPACILTFAIAAIFATSAWGYEAAQQQVATQTSTASAQQQTQASSELAAQQQSQTSAATQPTTPTFLQATSDTSASEGGIIYVFNDEEKTAAVDGYDKNKLPADGKVTIPEKISSEGNEYSVTKLNENCFAGCTSLTSIVIPDSVTSTGYGCFTNCTQLETVKFSENMTSLPGTGDSRYGGGFFQNCTSLKSVTIPNNITSIGGQCFKGCTSLTDITIPDSVTTLGTFYSTSDNVGQCFGDCTSLKSIVIPDSVTRVVGSCFYNCTSLENVMLSKNMTELPSCSYYRTTGFFEKCTSLKNITIPSGITSLDYYCFKDCTSLSSITISDSVTSLGASCFESCSLLTDVTLSKNLTSIGSSAFKGCYSLENLNIPDNVTSIGELCFRSCASLKSITIPNSVTKIGGGCFYSCNKLESITLSKNLTSLPSGVIHWTTPITGSKTVGFFDYCTSLKEVVIPDNVTSLDEYCFQNCKSLETITLSKNLNTIGKYCFYYCSALKEISIPDSVTSLGADCFSSCTALETATISKSLSSLPSNCFNYCTSLQNVTIADSVTSINSFCFYSCSSLKSITIPDSVTYIDGGCFAYCENLETVKLSNNITELPTSSYTSPRGLFEDCNALKNINIPNSVTFLGSNCFKNCTSLPNITIPKNVTSIGEDCFRNSTALTEIVFEGDAITKSWKYAFYPAPDNRKYIFEKSIPDAITQTEGMTDDNSYYRVKFIDDAGSVIAKEDVLKSSCNPSVEVSAPENVPASPITGEVFEGWSSEDYKAVTNSGMTITALYKEAEKVSISDTRVSASIDAQNYAASQIKPDTSAIHVTYKKDAASESVTLTEGVSYTVSDYGENINAGTGTGSIKISGMGSFNGEHTISFDIIPKQLDLIWGTTTTFTYSGKKQAPSAKVTGAIDPDTNPELVIEGAQIDIGSYSATAKLPDGVTNYKLPDNTSCAFYIIGKDITAATVSGIETSYTQTGSAIIPELKLTTRTETYQTVTLEAGTDYDVNYKDNVNIGTATVIITGKGIWAGTIIKTFAIIADPDPDPDPEPDPDPDPEPDPDPDPDPEPDPDPDPDPEPNPDPTPTPSVASWNRLSGGSALTTMKAIVNKGWESSDYAIVATSQGYQDALSASALAGLLGNAPVLLTKSNELSSQTKSLLTSKGVKNVIIVGGTGAVSSDVETAIGALGCSVERIAGGTATTTATAVYKWGADASKTGGTTWGKDAIVATLDSFQDALSIAPYAYAKHAPIFLTDKGTKDIRSSVQKYISEGGFDRTLIVGGTGAVSESVVDKVVSPNRLYGGSAYTTSKAIANFALSEGMSATNMGVACGTTYQDALVGASFLGKLGCIIALADDKNSTTINSVVAKQKDNLSECYIFGGEKAVSQAVEDKLKAAIK